MSSLGVDIEEVQRFKTLIRNSRFMERVYTPQERAYCRSKKNKLEHYAVRFAAKEAVWKALSDQLIKMKVVLGHRDIGVENDTSGKPRARLPKKLSKLEKKISLSLSHTRSTVVAVALFQNK
ncbi:MAG: Holo-[acyl-carrier-protein] synthase [Elusimicrobia bacterium]|nr:Holo-[acyl-carrier-protein] synthase [Elusimicrobiota bacterium]